VRRFFIIGPARCRTAWLAAFLSHGTTHCFHELSRLASSLEDFHAKLNASPHTVVGDSDSGLCLNIKPILDAYPDARYLLIDRPFSHVVKSFEAYFNTRLPREAWEKLLRIYCTARSTVSAHPNARCVLFADLNDESTIKSVWDFCTFGSFWRGDHYDLFKDLVIQVPRDYDLTHKSGFLDELVQLGLMNA